MRADAGTAVVETIGLVGLGVMGGNLARNLVGRGVTVVGYDRNEALVRTLQSELPAVRFIAAPSLEQLVGQLERPRVVLLMVPAGPPVDETIDELVRLLDRGDLIIDGGNSHYADTERRYEALRRAGIHFLGVGVSGGMKGALHGPALMPGGDREAYGLVEPIFRRIAARSDYGPSVAYMGKRSAGHFVKMVHNAIEYALIEALAEAYEVLRHLLGLAPREVADVFAGWSNEPFGGYLLDASSQVLKLVDARNGNPLVDSVLDVAGQKGTGLWATQTAVEHDFPAMLVSSSLFSRFASARRELRLAIATHLPAGQLTVATERKTLEPSVVKGALTFTFLASFLEGLLMLEFFSRKFDYATNLLDVLKVWRAGSIVACNLIDSLISVTTRCELSEYDWFVFDEKLRGYLVDNFQSTLEFSEAAKTFGIPTPVVDSALNLTLMLCRSESSASFIQLVRDHFGYHGFELRDLEGVFHVDDFQTR